MNLNTLRAHIAKRGGFAFIESTIAQPVPGIPRLAERPDERLMERPRLHLPRGVRQVANVFQRVAGRTYLVPVYMRQRHSQVPSWT